MAAISASSAWAAAQLGDERLGGLEALGDDLLGRRGWRRRRSSSIVFSVASASTIMIATSPPSSTRPATTMSKVARSSSAWVGKATHWPSMSATRVAPTGPLNGRPESWVDADAALMATHVVGVVGVERHHGDDDLDLVAQALDEGRAQRPVDEPAGEDGVLAGAALAAEERAGDAARGVHALLDVDGQREEVEALARVLAGRGGRQQHGVVVEVGDDRSGGLLGQPAGLEADGAGAEPAVVDDGDGLVDAGFGV